MFFGNKRFNSNYDFQAEENKRTNQKIRNKISKILEDEKPGHIDWSSSRIKDELQSIEREIQCAKRYNNINLFVLDADLKKR